MGRQRAASWATTRTRTGQAGSQPENALLQCRLPPDAITANEETSCRPPFLFSFFLSHTHTHRHKRAHAQTRTYTNMSMCVCVCDTHTATYPVAFDNSPQNVKNDEKLAPERSPSPHRRRRRRLAYVLVMACVVLLLGCHVAALPLAQALSLSLALSFSVLCLSKYLCRAALRASCLTGFFLFRLLLFFSFFGSSCACRLSDY